MPKAEEVVEYLKKHPCFFDEHEELLAEMDLGSAKNSTPFYARQIKVLKDRETQQQSKIDLIVDSVTNNQRLESDLLEMAIRLLSEGRNGADPSETVIAMVKCQFNVNGVAVLVNTGDADQRHSKYDEVHQRVTHKSSICDDRVSSKLLESLYGESSGLIQSCAFVPLLYSNNLTGVMVLGSNSEERFQPGAGVLYLDRLGLLVGGFIQGAPETD